MSETIKSGEAASETGMQPRTGDPKPRPTADPSHFGPVGGLGIVAAALGDKRAREAAKGQPLQRPRSDSAHSSEQLFEN